MPKPKSHSGAKKRFKLTATGKVMYKKAGLRHLLTGMSANRGRRLRKSQTLGKAESKLVKRLIPH